MRYRDNESVRMKEHGVRTARKHNSQRCRSKNVLYKHFLYNVQVSMY